MPIPAPVNRSNGKIRTADTVLKLAPIAARAVKQAASPCQPMGNKALKKLFFS
jgi:hypothetical protein